MIEEAIRHYGGALNVHAHAVHCHPHHVHTPHDVGKYSWLAALGDLAQARSPKQELHCIEAVWGQILGKDDSDANPQLFRQAGLQYCLHHP